MKKITLLDKKIIMDNPDSLHNYFAWPTVTTLRDGTLAVGASGFRFDHVCPFGKSVISYSFDEGEHWTAPAAVIDTILDDRDVGILNFGENDVIFTSFNNSTAFQKKAVGDAPGTACDYRRAYLAHAEKNVEAEKAFLGSTFKFSRDGGKSFEKKIYKSPVTSPHGPMVTADGKLLYIGNAFGVSPTRIESWEIDGKDGSMTKLGTVPPIEGGSLPSVEPHAIALADGSILLVIRTERQPEKPSWQNAYTFFTLYSCVSRDGGRTFSEPQPMKVEDGSFYGFENIGAPPHLLRHSSGVLILSTAARLRPFGIHVLFSTNEGESWQGAVLTEDVPDSADLGYAATTELSDGSLYTVWYQHPALGAPAVIYGAHWRMDE